MVAGAGTPFGRPFDHVPEDVALLGAQDEPVAEEFPGCGTLKQKKY
jgi:hypothetical protein